MVISFDQFKKNVLEKCISCSSSESSLPFILQDNIDKLENGIVAEFGVFSGRTLNLIRQKTPNQLAVWGFDCFTGLPDHWRDGFDKGTFNLNGNIPFIEDGITISKGLFQNTLPLLEPYFKNQVSRLIHIDCDIYSAAIYVLYQLEKTIVKGTIIVFDELIGYPGYEDHELKALYEFCKEFKKSFEVLCAFEETVAIRFV